MVPIASARSVCIAGEYSWYQIIEYAAVPNVPGRVSCSAAVGRLSYEKVNMHTISSVVRTGRAAFVACRTWPLVRIAFAASVLALSPRLAAAQDAPPRLTVAAGVGMANPLYADFDFNAPEWQVSLRHSVNRHFALEGGLADWRHTDTRVSLDQAISGPSGFLGRVARAEQRTTYEMRTIAVNGLGTGTSGRVTFAGGGGIGVLLYKRNFLSSYTGCDASIPQVCRTFGNTFTSDGMSVQGVAEVDVAVVSRVATFARYQLVAAVRDVGFGQGTIAGGVRVTLW
jgi:hypothetical protein